ncbi:chromatin associated protein KTI12 [Sordaria brevicollis]|uniref:Chromatin associated protein KTI12 n=1 Tax=Sordaria brevicollis TaxID=83679 RepID=A0AAE0P1V1_SORBR|nr:chromatin associated protein KTI12 [Sordaria brevicollis]
MPLILITGLPTSGKSTRASQLYDYLTERIASDPSTSSKFRLHLISDQTLSISRSVYDLDPAHTPAHVRSANASEKDARAALYGAVKRVLSPRDIVILDTLNYIKGWRYQLYCEAKNVQTPFGLVQVGCPVTRARGVNEARIRRQEQQQQSTQPSTTDTGATIPTAAAAGAAPKSGDLHPETYQQSHQNWQQKQFEESTTEPDSEEVQLSPTDVQEPYLPRSNWENLVFRYEEPNPMTRWDSPLFILTWNDTPEEARKVFDQIWDEVVVNKPQKLIRANKSTVQRDKDPGGDYLYVLEKETQDIVKRILEQQAEVGEGGTVRLGRSGNGDQEVLEVELPGKKVGLPQLQRYRRAFVGLNRGGIGLEAVGTLAAGRLRESFVGYLNDAFEKEM